MTTFTLSALCSFSERTSTCLDKIADSPDLRGRDDEDLIGSFDHREVGLVQGGGAIDDNVVVFTTQKVQGLSHRYGIGSFSAATGIRRRKDFESAGMGCDITAEQFAVQPAEVAHEFVEVITAAIDSEIDASMAQLRMVVDQQMSSCRGTGPDTSRYGRPAWWFPLRLSRQRK